MGLTCSGRCNQIFIFAWTVGFSSSTNDAPLLSQWMKWKKTRYFINFVNLITWRIWLGCVIIKASKYILWLKPSSDLLMWNGSWINLMVHLDDSRFMCLNKSFKKKFAKEWTYLLRCHLPKSKMYLILRIQMEVHVCEYKFEVMTPPCLLFLIQVISTYMKCFGIWFISMQKKLSAI